MLSTLFYFIIALVLLVTIHEYGHFIVARWCGVKVLRFSFGFGKVLARWRDKRGTEYVWSLLPLGGYIKMLDEEEGPVPENERHLAFNNKPVLSRIAVVIAGPLFNLIFAFLALWLVLIIGMYTLAPIIGEIKPGSPAAQAGLTAKEELLAVNDKPVASWHDFQYMMFPLIGSNESISLQVKPLQGAPVTKMLSLENWQLDAKKPDPLKSLGITPFMPAIVPIVAKVLPDSPAAKVEFKAQDRILKINNKPITDWTELLTYVRKNPSTPVNLTVLRQGKEISIPVVIGSKQENNKSIGFLGLLPKKPVWPAQWLRYERQNPFTALGTAFTQTVNLTKATVILMGRFVSGKLAWQAISGPVGIAQGAGESARSGLVAYLTFLALISISLGVLNLLPIPLLDGGHLLYYCVEIFISRKVSNMVKAYGSYLGFVFLIALMVLALSNDLMRVIAG